MLYAYLAVLYNVYIGATKLQIFGWDQDSIWFPNIVILKRLIHGKHSTNNSGFWGQFDHFYYEIWMSPCLGWAEHKYGWELTLLIVPSNQTELL